MKNSIIVILTLLLSISLATKASGQPSDPEVMILTPHTFTYEKQFKSEVKQVNEKYSGFEDISQEEVHVFTNSVEFLAESENVQRMMLSQLEFYREFDLAKYVTAFSFTYLSYRIVEYFPESTVIPVSIKSAGEIAELGELAIEAEMRYVLNFPEIRLYKKGKESYADITVQLYDDFTKSFVVDEVFSGDSSNPGFEFNCEDGSVECTIHNALVQVIYTVLYEIAEGNPVIQRERELAGERYHELFKYYYKPYDKDFLDEVISLSDTTIVRADMYQLLQDPSGTKFVAFFITDEGPSGGLDNINGGGLVTIISGKDLTDPLFLEETPKTYAYIVTGLKYEGKWYYKKSNATYFECAFIEEGQMEYFSNLSDWEFFIEDSTIFNPGFWDGYLFPKVLSAHEKYREHIELNEMKMAISGDEEEKEFYQEMIDHYLRDEEKNREYLGLYEIVADHFRREKRDKEKLFMDRITNDILEPFYSKYCRENGLERYHKHIGKILMIFSQDYSQILCPIVFDYGEDQRRLHFFVLLSDGEGDYSIYEWNYFNPLAVEVKIHYGSEVMERISELTKWNFSFETLDDSVFWENYVLTMSDGSYKYLTPMN